jgi:hypothetical protein
MIKIEIANLSVALENKYPFIEEFARDYICEGTPDFSVSVSDDKINNERMTAGGKRLSDGYLESICLYREIAERLPDYDAFVFHGCVLAFDGAAYLIAAQSGVGKTTHARNWLSFFKSSVHILNGDKPVIRIIDGVPYACATPWRGKENYGVNEKLPLKSIVFLERGSENLAFPISKSDALTKFMKQIYIPRENKLSLVKTMRLADKILGMAKLFAFACTKEEDSARVLYDALIKE